MRLDLVQLPDRVLPAALFDPAVYGFDPFPDAPGVPVRVAFGDVTGAERVEWIAGSGQWIDVPVLDMVVAAGEGGGFRVKVYDGGRADKVEVFDPITGGTHWIPRDYGRLLADFQPIDDQDCRTGADLAVKRDGTIYVTALPGGGPILSEIRVTLGAGDAVSVSKRVGLIPGFSETYRGGVSLDVWGRKLFNADVDRTTEDLLVMPRYDTDPALRGGPILTVLTPDGDSLVMPVGDLDSRAPHRFAPALIGVTVDAGTGEMGFAVESDHDLDGVYERTDVFTWGGRLVDTVRIGDPDTEWWL